MPPSITAINASGNDRHQRFLDSASVSQTAEVACCRRLTAIWLAVARTCLKAEHGPSNLPACESGSFVNRAIASSERTVDPRLPGAWVAGVGSGYDHDFRNSGSLGAFSTSAAATLAISSWIREGPGTRQQILLLRERRAKYNVSRLRMTQGRRRRETAYGSGL
jgi:hypothetical protein